MNRLTIALIVAQSGLGTAASLLEAEGNKRTLKNDEKGAAKVYKLAKALRAANDGITSFLKEG